MCKIYVFSSSLLDIITNNLQEFLFQAVANPEIIQKGVKSAKKGLRRLDSTLIGTRVRISIFLSF